MKIAIITGASSGLGREFAYQLDNDTSIEQYWLIARRTERMEELAGKLKTPCKILTMDVTDEEQLHLLEVALEEEKPSIVKLLNCSGFGLMGRFENIPLDRQIGMVEVNCIALTKITFYCLNYMEKESRIIQIASSAAFLPQPNFAIYAATKAYVESFTIALAEELREKHIYVTAVTPGPVKTEFFDIAEKDGTKLAIKKYVEATSEKVVARALKNSRQKRLLSVYSWPIKGFHLISRILPWNFLMWFERKLK